MSHPELLAKINTFSLSAFRSGLKLKNMQNDYRFEDIHDSFAYIAPEVFTEKSFCSDYITKESDMWSFGVIAFVLLTGRLPFASLEQILNVAESPSWHEDKDIKDLVDSCLSRDQFARPLAKDLIDSHPLFKKFVHVKDAQTPRRKNTFAVDLVFENKINFALDAQSV